MDLGENKTATAYHQFASNMRINFKFYKDHDNVPIEEVAEALGIQQKKNGKYLCVFHDDTNPSMVISTKGKYENTCHCFSCTETGDPLMLVMAAKYGVIPSKFWATPADVRRTVYKEAIEGAAEFIEEMFPGAITYYEKAENNNKDQYKRDSDGFPFIPSKILKVVKLPLNFMGIQRIRPYADILNDKEKKFDIMREYIEDNNKTVVISPLEKRAAINMLSDKLNEYLTDLINYKKVLNEQFPEMPEEGVKYINEKLADNYDMVNNYLTEVEAYIEKMDKDIELNPESLEETGKDVEQYFKEQEEEVER